MVGRVRGRTHEQRSMTLGLLPEINKHQIALREALNNFIFSDIVQISLDPYPPRPIVTKRHSDNLVLSRPLPPLRK